MATSSKNRKICPLFQEAPEPIFADQIGSIHVMAVMRDQLGKSRREVIAEKMIEPDPYKTTKEDIAKAYPEYKEFYVAATDVETGRIIPGGYNFAVSRVEEPDDDDEDERPARGSGESAQEMLNLMRSMVEKQLEQASQRSSETMTVATQIAGLIGGNRGASVGDQAVLDAMKAQMRMLETQLDDARRTYRDDLNKRDRDLEDLRTGYRDDVDRRRREADAERERLMRDIEERRTRYDRDIMELRQRSEKEIAELRARYEKRIEELQKDTFELRKDLTDADAAKAPAEAPWWAGMLANAAGPVMEWLAKQNAAVQAQVAQQVQQLPPHVQQQFHAQQQAYVEQQQAAQAQAYAAQQAYEQQQAYAAQQAAQAQPASFVHQTIVRDDPPQAVVPQTDPAPPAPAKAVTIVPPPDPEESDEDDADDGEERDEDLRIAASA